MQVPEELRKPVVSHHTKHEAECDQALEAIYKKRWHDAALKGYSLIKSMSVGAIMGHVVLGLESLPVVKKAAGSVFGTFVAGKVAFLNIMQGWGASGSAKRYGFPGFKKKKLAALEKNLDGVRKLNTVMDRFEAKFSIPDMALYEAQGRVLTVPQRIGLTAACAGRAVVITGIFFGAVHVGTHYLVAHNAASIVHPELPLGAKTAAAHHHAATHVPHVLQSHPFLQKVWTGIKSNDAKLTVLPDKIIGLAGLLAVTTPIHVSSAYRRRRIVCKRYFDGHHVLNLPFMPVRRKAYHRPMGIPRPLLERAIQDEMDYRRACQESGKPVITRGRQLSKQARQEADAKAFGHSVQ